ncbi:MAG TPA: PEP-CTERM sorting domain-containing protein [Candidatus Sulfotelmatobacter sp.]|jgi:subtilisin-like proprotein convertase family protein|nr:PEP-CTERM sorting domain-containing protein [Candidatus Sulfotelmatobacter sp.]
MRITRLTLIVAAWLLAVVVHAQTNFTYSSGTLNTAIPDGNPVGITSSTTTAGLSGNITNITVNLNISGGFNGDLYAYLAGPNGQFAVLLNRVGMNSGNAFGYSDTGFDITLNMTGANIHNYQSGGLGSYTLNGSSQLTGSWGADGTTVNSLSQPPSAFDSAPVTADLNNYYGTGANGGWTLFVADLSSGNQSTLVSWGFTINTAPEPSTWAMIAGGAAMLFAFRRRR